MCVQIRARRDKKQRRCIVFTGGPTNRRVHALAMDAGNNLALSDVNHVDLSALHPHSQPGHRRCR
jgi:hypothetical protein